MSDLIPFRLHPQVSAAPSAGRWVQAHGGCSFSQECRGICYVACSFDINNKNLNAIIILSFDYISLVNQMTPKLIDI